MTYRLDMDRNTRVLVSHMSPVQRRKTKETLRTIAMDPFEGKALQDDLAGLRSCRVGPLRVVYQIHTGKKIVHVITIGPRRTVYKELEKELRAKERS